MSDDQTMIKSMSDDQTMMKSMSDDQTMMKSMSDDQTMMKSISDDQTIMKSMSDDQTMKMHFHSGYDEIILFEFFHISSVCEMVIVAFGFFILSCLSESFKFSREYIIRRFARSYHEYKRVPQRDVEDKLELDDPKVDIKSQTFFTTEHSVLTLLYLVQVLISYTLMMVFMTCNVWLCGAMIIGHAVGNWLFATMD